MTFEIRPLVPDDAAEVAAIHAQGQPGTFLTSLGPAFLRGMYRQLAAAPECYGYVALREGNILGVVVGAPASGGVLKRVMLLSGLRLFFPLLGAILRQPALIARAWETLSYGEQFEELEGEGELLFIGVREQGRGQEVGQALFLSLAAAFRERGMRWMTLTVAEANERAMRFYQRQGMQVDGMFELYGRKMHRCVLRLVGGEGA